MNEVLNPVQLGSPFPALRVAKRTPAIRVQKLKYSLNPILHNAPAGVSVRVPLV